MYTYDIMYAYIVLKNIIPAHDPRRIPEEFLPVTYIKKNKFIGIILGISLTIIWTGIDYFDAAFHNNVTMKDKDKMMNIYMKKTYTYLFHNKKSRLDAASKNH